MGFKWFKARIFMNREPKHSSAIAGSYRSTVFDSPINEFSTNNSTITNGYARPDQKLNSKAVSMPNLSNPMAEISNEDEQRLGFVKMSNTENGQHKSSAKTSSELELNGPNAYFGLVTGNPLLLNTNTSQQGLKDNIAITTPRPVIKLNKTEYKKKKAKAPAPKTKLSTESGSTEFITLQNQRKSSQGSDIDV